MARVVARVLVTGAAGYIGSALLRSWPEAEVTALDDFSAGARASLAGLPRPVRLLESDLLALDDSQLASALAGQEVCVHLCALVDAAGSLGKDEAYMLVNAEGVNRLARACLRAGVPLVFLSSTSVYGPQAGAVDETLPVWDYAPASPYAHAKRAAELLLAQYYGPRGLKYVILRCGTMYGTAGGTAVGWRAHTFVNHACWQAAYGQPVTVWRQAWDSHRPYCALPYALAAIRRAARGDFGWGQTINVLTGNHTVREVLTLLRAHVPDVAVDETDAPLLNQQGYLVGSTLVRLGAGDGHDDLRDGIRETLRWLRPDLLSKSPDGEASSALASAGADVPRAAHAIVLAP